MKTGLVMEGGAMRGMFTAGVIDIMMEHKMEFDGEQYLDVIISPNSRGVLSAIMQRTVTIRIMQVWLRYCEREIFLENSFVIMIFRIVSTRLILIHTAIIRCRFMWLQPIWKLEKQCITEWMTVMRKV